MVCCCGNTYAVHVTVALVGVATLNLALPPPPRENLLESLYTENSDMEGLQIFAHGAILCPNWTHLYTVSL